MLFKLLHVHSICVLYVGVLYVSLVFKISFYPFVQLDSSIHFDTIGIERSIINFEGSEA